MHENTRLDIIRLLRSNSRIGLYTISRSLDCHLPDVYQSLQDIIDFYSAKYISLIDFDALGLSRYICIVCTKDDIDNSRLIEFLYDSNIVNTLTLSEHALIMDLIVPNKDILVNLMKNVCKFDIIGLRTFKVKEIVLSENFFCMSEHMSRTAD